MSGWFVGDQTGLSIPAHPQALAQGGATFLTRAFHAVGTLPPDNAVARVESISDCPGGSTGAKCFLTLTYARQGTDLPTGLFVKFSRDFTNPIRDRNRDQLLPEIEFAGLSRHPAFPIPVPRALFGDVERATGTGLLITERIGFGTGGIEPHHDKCLDYSLPDPVRYYRAIVTVLGRLSGAARTPPLAGLVTAHFPYDAAAAAGSDLIRYDAAQFRRRIDKLAAFVRHHPRLLPDRVATPGFLASFAQDIPRFLERQTDIRHFLAADRGHIALCHWNGNIDNAWFWTGPDGILRCGLLDWGRVGQMHLGLALWGALSAAEPEMIDQHLDGLLGLFAVEFASVGGGPMEVGILRERMFLHVALMGLAWLMDAPTLILRELPDLDPMADRFDACFQQNETARVQLHMLTNFLTLWERHRFGLLLDQVP
jgi:hypothetical protein